jgi:hypothetical protein
VLTAQAGGIVWQTIAQEALTKGSFLNMVNTATSGSLSLFDGNIPATISVDATSANTASKVVARDASGNFSATMITSGVTLLANPTSVMHAVTKQYADNLTPVGLISLWYGSVGSIPGGWALCNGSNGTPDLRNRFVLGAGSTYAVGAIGGTKDAVVVSHSHAITGSTSTADLDHNHNEAMSYPSGGSIAAARVNYSGDPPVTGGMNQNRFHSHTITATATTEGVSGTDQNLPPYYALCYIMKI